MHIFTYGTLMSEQVWSTVVVGRYARREAVIVGYRRLAVRGKAYPGLVPGAAGDMVRGLLRLAIDDRDLERLDRYEGEYYRRERCECRLADGSILPAQLYVFKGRYRHLLEEREWQPDGS